MNGRRSLHGLSGLLLLLVAAGCHNTARGVRADTRRALDKTGQALEKAGEKIDRHKRQDDH